MGRFSGMEISLDEKNTYKMTFSVHCTVQGPNQTKVQILQ